MQPLTGDRKFRDDIVRIAELTVNTSMLIGYEFTNCRIVGPAVLVPLGNTSLQHIDFNGSLDAIFWEILPERQEVLGGVGVQDCLFSSCRMDDIGIAGPASLRELLRSSGLA